MYHALRIQEILLNIFGHCFSGAAHRDPDRRFSTASLAALARTCREFKDPALDMLWSELVTLTPLPRCIPEACCVTQSGQCYSFKRQPDEAEWLILRSYTRRVWHIFDYGPGSIDGWLDYDSLIAICSSPVTDPLFPNLRSLYWLGREIIPAVHVAVPSLTSLFLSFKRLRDVTAFKDFLDTVEAFCPNIKQCQISMPGPHILDGPICSCIRRQPNLQALSCCHVAFDADTICHLSGIPTLTRLSLTWIPDVSDWTLSSGSASVFSTLVRLNMGSQSLELVTRLLSCIRLPVVEDLNTECIICPSKEAFRTYITTLQNVCSSNSLARIEMYSSQSFGFDGVNDRLTLDDVRPYMAFVNVRHIDINIGWSVDLTDSDLLMLVSVWPHIHTLDINKHCGWRTTGGITLQGLLQLLQKCQSLSELCIALRTDSYADLPHGFEMGFLPPPGLLTLNLADSPIQSADAPALVDVFVKLGLRPRCFLAWRAMGMGDVEGILKHRCTWDEVFDRVMKRFSGPNAEQGLVVDGVSGYPFFVRNP